MRKKYAYPIFFSLACLLLFLPLIYFVSRVPGDDFDFVTMAGERSLGEHLRFVYTTYSGRITAKILEYAAGSSPVMLWKVVEFFSLSFLSVFLYKFFSLFDQKHPVIRMSFALLLPFGMGMYVYQEANLWMAGTTNYGILVSLSMAGFYFLFRYFLFDSLCPARYKKVSVLAGSLLILTGAAGSEQLSAIFWTLGLILNVYIFVQLRKETGNGGENAALKEKPEISALKKKLLTGGILWLLLTAIFLINYLLCPGTAGRFSLEAALLPNYDSYSFLQKLHFGIRWFMNASLHNIGFLPMLLWLTEAALLFPKKKPLAIVLLAFSILYGFSFLFPSLVDFELGWGRGDFSAAGYLKIVLWAIPLLLSLVSLFFLFEKNWKKSVTAALFLSAGFASTAIMMVSPSMYASGGRTQYISAIIFSCLIGYLYLHLPESNKKEKAVRLFLFLLLMIACLLLWGRHFLRLLTGGFAAFL